MMDLSSPYAVTNYNSIHKRLGGIMLARYWTIIISVLLFIIIAIIGAVSAQSTITSGQSSFMAGDYEKGASAIDSLFSMGETLGYVFLALGIVLSITLLILFIMFIVRLYAYRSFLRGTGAAKGATALIIALWLNIGFSILLGVLLAIALRSYGESNDNLTIIPMVGFVVALVVEIAGYAMLKSSDDLYPGNRSGFSKLLVADCFYLVAIIISAITLLVGGDSDAMTILPIISGIVALVSLIIAMVGWGRVRRPVFDPGAYAAVPAAQPVAPKPAAAPRPAPAPRPAVAPAAARPAASKPAAAVRPAPAAPKPAVAPAAKPVTPAAKPVAPAPKPAAAAAAAAARPAPAAPKPAAAPAAKPVAAPAAPKPATPAAPAVPSQASAAPKPAAARPKFCFNCGSPLPDHGNFCPRCGTKIA